MHHQKIVNVEKTNFPSKLPFQTFHRETFHPNFPSRLSIKKLSIDHGRTQAMPETPKRNNDFEYIEANHAAQRSHLRTGIILFIDMLARLTVINRYFG